MGEKENNQEPLAQTSAGSMHDGPGGEGCLTPTLAAMVTPPFLDVKILPVTALWTSESVRPSDLKEVLTAILLRFETFHEFHEVHLFFLHVFHPSRLFVAIVSNLQALFKSIVIYRYYFPKPLHF